MRFNESVSLVQGTSIDRTLKNPFSIFGFLNTKLGFFGSGNIFLFIFGGTNTDVITSPNKNPANTYQVSNIVYWFDITRTNGSSMAFGAIRNGTSFATTTTCGGSFTSNILGRLGSIVNSK